MKPTFRIAHESEKIPKAGLGKTFSRRNVERGLLGAGGWRCGECRRMSLKKLTNCAREPECVAFFSCEHGKQCQFRTQTQPKTLTVILTLMFVLSPDPSHSGDRGHAACLRKFRKPSMIKAIKRFMTKKAPITT
eukprot:3587502-Rhodomonas_salina.1